MKYLIIALILIMSFPKSNAQETPTIKKIEAVVSAMDSNTVTPLEKYTDTIPITPGFYVIEYYYTPSTKELLKMINREKGTQRVMTFYFYNSLLLKAMVTENFPPRNNDATYYSLDNESAFFGSEKIDEKKAIEFLEGYARDYQEYYYKNIVPRIK